MNCLVLGAGSESSQDFEKSFMPCAFLEEPGTSEALSACSSTSTAASVPAGSNAVSMS